MIFIDPKRASMMTASSNPKPSARARVALVQAETRWADPPANRAHLAELMDRSAGCQLYVLPETCTTGFLGDVDCGNRLDPHGDLDWFRAQAAARRAAIAGSIVAKAGDTLFNRFLLVDASGAVTTYDKRHRFGFGGEGERYGAGAERVRADLFGRRVDLQVCYDLRFPVWCRNDDAFDLQIFVANWPSARASAWRTLLRARAIENQAFVIGVNRVGSDGRGIDYPGSSGAWDAQGDPLVGPLDDRERIVTVELDFAELDHVRRQFPFLADRDRFTIR
jgi:predicted amidohydrolase